MDVRIDCLVRMDVLELQVMRERVQAHDRIDEAGRQDGLDLRSKDELPGGTAGIIERLLAEAIAHGEQGAFGIVPQSKGEHPRKSGDERRADLVVQRENHLGV